MNTFAVGTYICIACFLLVIVMSIIDKRAEKHDEVILVNYITE